MKHTHDRLKRQSESEWRQTNIDSNSTRWVFVAVNVPSTTSDLSPCHDLTFLTDELPGNLVLKLFQTLCVMLQMEEDQKWDALFCQLLRTHTHTNKQFVML